MSQAEDPRRLRRKRDAQQVTVEDIRQLMGASTPHFALQLRNRIANLIADLPPDHPASSGPMRFGSDPAATAGGREFEKMYVRLR